MKHPISIVLLMTFLMLWPGISSGGDSLPLATGMCISKVESLIKKGKVKEAVKTLENFKANQKGLAPETAEKKGYSHYYIDFMLGNTCLMLSETGSSEREHYLKRAVSSYETTVKKKKDLSPAWLNLAKCCYDLGRMKRAANAFLKGYETGENKNAAHLYYASICYFQSNAHQKALNAFYRLMKQHPDKMTLEWRESLVSILFAMDKNKEALPHVEILTKQFKGEKKKKWQEILLYQYLDLKMMKKALQYGESLTRTEPLEPKWWKAVTHLHLNRNNLRKGLASLIIYSYLTPLSREETSLMADLYLSLGIPSKAAAYYETLLREKTGLEKIKRIIHAYTASYQRDKALAWINRGLAHKKDFSLLKQKAGLLYEMERYAEAADVYERLIKGSEKPGEYLLMLGYCAWNTEEFEKAGKAFNRAARYDRQKQAAQQAISRLNIRTKAKL